MKHVRHIQQKKVRSLIPETMRFYFRRFLSFQAYHSDMKQFSSKKKKKGWICWLLFAFISVKMHWWSTCLEITLLIISFIGMIIKRHEFRQNLALLLEVYLNIVGCLTSLSLFSKAIYMLLNSVRAYLLKLGGLYIFQAALLQYIYRLFVNVFLSSSTFAFVQFLICSLSLLPLLVNNQFPYYSDAQTCYIAFNDIISVLYPSISLWILRYISRRTQETRACLSVIRRLHKERRVLLRSYKFNSFTMASIILCTLFKFYW